ncbi:hypothetical protein NLU13_5779 [Sarocladium strictum]|uniref:Adenylosuccinate lyase C-terminal domain-containing protein n=1 Tax=Sarocladium strictum TaxID=5046 RepID=A0AA39L7Z3_SARSR|nr:hypothetical protein NLU13_5779 [Sarocladium strictum]
MASPYDTYQTSLTSRYCSAEISKLFSQHCEKELRINTITPKALQQIKDHLMVTNNDFEIARVEEKKRRHDVMAHVHAFGVVAPAAAGSIHLGATSCFVTDNAELVLMQKALEILSQKLAKVISYLARFVLKWKAEPTLAYTHLQAAQLITVGRRAAQWAQDLMLNLRSIKQVHSKLKFHSAQGTTGTQASLLKVFNRDSKKYNKLNKLPCKKFGLPACYNTSTQIYTHKVNLIIASAIARLSSSAQKITGNIRHLAHWKEIEEPFEKSQIGSSAMAYKRNPMRSEPCYLRQHPRRQWCERTLDDSAVRRIDIPEMFLLADAICIILDNIFDGLIVYPKRIAAHVQSELPSMITETIVMKLAAQGVSRQDAHEEIRVLSYEAGAVVKNEGKPNDLVERIRKNEFFKPIWNKLDSMLNAKLYISCSVEIVNKYCGPTIIA